MIDLMSNKEVKLLSRMEVAEKVAPIAILSNGDISYSLYPGITIIGKEEGKGQFIRLNQNEIESRHAAIRLHYENEMVKTADIMDFCSAIGTRINEERIKEGEWIRIESENWLNFGSISFKFSYCVNDDDSISEIPPSPEPVVLTLRRSIIPTQRSLNNTDDLRVVPVNNSVQEEEEEVIPETQQLPSQKIMSEDENSDFVNIDTETQHDLRTELIQSQICPAINESDRFFERSEDESIHLQLNISSKQKNEENIPDIFKETEEFDEENVENRNETVTPDIDEIERSCAASPVTSLATTESKTTIDPQDEKIDNESERINNDDNPNSDDSDYDIFTAPTQKINAPIKKFISETKVDSNTDDNIYLAATQRFTKSTGDIELSTRDDNIYEALTQVLPREYLQITATPNPPKFEIRPTSQPDTDESDIDFATAQTMIVASQQPPVNTESNPSSSKDSKNDEISPTPENSIFFDSLSQFPTPDIFHIKLPRPIVVKHEENTTPKKINDENAMKSPQASSTAVKQKPVLPYQDDSSSQLDLDNINTPDFLNLPSKEQLEEQVKNFQKNAKADDTYFFEDPMDETETEVFEEAIEREPHTRTRKVTDKKEVVQKSERQLPKPKLPHLVKKSLVLPSVTPVDTEPSTSRNPSNRKRTKPTKLAEDYVTESQMSDYGLKSCKQSTSTGLGKDPLQERNSKENIKITKRNSFPKVVIKPIAAVATVLPQSIEPKTETKNSKIRKRKASKTISSAETDSEDEEEKIVKKSPKKLRKVNSSDTGSTSSSDTKQSLAKKKSYAKPISPKLSVKTRSSSELKQKILFTMVKKAEFEDQIKEAGHTLVESVSEATVLVSDKVYRSAKFLSAVARALPIVSVSWLNSDKHKFDPDLKKYLINDRSAEDKYRFSLRNTLEKVAENGAVLKDYSIACSPSTKPFPHEIKMIVESSGGKFYEKLNDIRGKNCLVVASPEDSKFIKTVKKRKGNMKIINSEAFMLTVLRNELVLEKKYLL